jgi:ribonuclease HII
MRVLGIDEAGRGCVLGPLVVAGYVIDGVHDDVLRAAGAADSKTLSPKRRDEARERLAPLGTADVRRIPATAIDEGNLNVLEERVIVELVALWRPDLVICDALGHPRTLPAVIARLRRDVALVTPDVAGQRWLMEPRADGTHAVVGAASIFAKTTRDAALDALRAEWGQFGSGYPSDPETRAWLATWSATGKPWPDFVRTRWGTIRAIAQQGIFS